MKGIRIDAHTSLAALVGLAAGAGGGALAGYLLARRSFAKRLTQEVVSIKAHYNARAEATSTSSNHENERPPSVGRPGVERRLISVSDADFYKPGHEDASPPPVAHNGDPLDGYPEDDDDDDDDEEPQDAPDDEPERIDTGPYVIARDTFENEYLTHSKLTITYYEKDGVLADDEDHPIAEIATTVGPNFISRFGDNSGDPNLVYIRNHRLATDFEVLRDDRSYAEVVLKFGKPQ